LELAAIIHENRGGMNAMDAKPTPPRWATRLLHWYCAPHLMEEVQGDLQEEFDFQVKKVGVTRARLDYIRNVLGFIKPFAIKRKKKSSLNNYGMIKSYFKIGWRNLLRSKGYSIINIGGLAIGMTVAILNGLWIWDELSFNKYFQRYEKIAQVAYSATVNGERGVGTTMTYPLGTELITNQHQYFNHVVRTSGDREYILSTGDKNLSCQGLYTDEAAPELFTFKMIYGSRNGLGGAHSIMISNSFAKALFGDIDPVNKSIRLNNKMDVTIGGVYEDFPFNTQFYDIKFFGNWSLFLLDDPEIEERFANNWRSHFIEIYVEIIPETNFQWVSERLKNIIKVDPLDAEKFALQKREFLLYPMSDWHLFPYDDRGEFNKGRINQEPIRMIWMVGMIGAFVLALACINFMNLSTARSEKRAKEVGIRKTIGSVRLQLISQFFSESVLVVVFAFALSVILVNTFLPLFNDVAGKQMKMPWTNTTFWLLSIGFILLTSIVAGSYPALYLSSFNPVKALKGTFRVGRMASLPRKVLVVIQFSISVILVIGTIVVYQQIQFAKNRPVGYTREGLITIPKKTDDFFGKFNVLRTELLNTNVVEDMSESVGKVTEVASNNNGWSWDEKAPGKDKNFATLAVTANHGRTVGWQFVQGQDFAGDSASDSLGIVINESALRFMNLKDPIGQPVSWTWWRDLRVQNYKILGVVKDMVMDSPYKQIEPTIFFVKGFNHVPVVINIRVKSQASMADALPKIEAVFKKIIPSAPFDYQFVDDEYAKKFASEEKVGKLVSIFAGLAIFISCLGLLGLSSFVAEQRTKEIGVRKILGASVANLWQMLSKDFVALVIISCFIAIPIGYYFMHNWLQNYQYRTEISWWIFLITSIGALTVTLATVSFQAIKAALMNPVNSLRSE
jgi:putative ABC transport system permease protein